MSSGRDDTKGHFGWMEQPDGSRYTGETVEREHRMQYNPNFDVDAVLELLRGVNEKYQEGSPEDEAIRVAAVALFYVRETQKLAQK